MKAFHFTGNTLRDGRPIPERGKWLEHHGELVPCKSGLHASKHPFDALQYATGPILHLVELEGDLTPHGNPVDKYVGRRRKITKSLNVTMLLYEFARHCALDVVHLWDCPPVVRQYLETGDENLKVAAWYAAKATAKATAKAAAEAAAWDAADVAAWYAAEAAAEAAAKATAWYVAWYAAWSAARATAGGAAWYAAWYAAEAAAEVAAKATAGGAAWYAAEAVARAAAGGAASDATWDATVRKQRRRFARMVARAMQEKAGEK